MFSKQITQAAIPEAEIVTTSELQDQRMKYIDYSYQQIMVI